MTILELNTRFMNGMLLRGTTRCRLLQAKSFEVNPFCSRFFRELLLYEAHELLASHEFKRALEVADSAENWPSTAKPGRVDYLKAAALAALGERNAAEDHFLRSYRSDPYYFWCVADLAVFYASSELPLTQRRQMASPYLDTLRTRFAHHRDFAQYMVRIQEHLAGPDAAAAGD